MARAPLTKLPQPVFHEPIFGADGSLPDPTGFSTLHGSDDALYKQIGDLATKELVAIPKSRIGDDQMFSTWRKPMALTARRFSSRSPTPAGSYSTRSAIPAPRTPGNIPTSCGLPIR